MINVDDRLIVELDPAAYQLLSFLASKVNKDRLCWYKNATICEALNWSMKRLQAAKRRLVDKGYMEVEERFNGRAQVCNYYKIITPLIKNYTPTPKGGRGGTSKVGSTPASKVGNQEVLISEALTIESNTPPAGDVSGKEDFFQKEKLNTGSEAGELDITSRTAKFRQDVLAIGETIYTEQMLENFIEYYSQTNGAKKPKMKWEIYAKTGWEIAPQLQAWANRNLTGIRCYLTPEQKTIAEKKLAFKQQLDYFLPRYGREILNTFYQNWAQPENVENPRYLRWEKEPYWDLAMRLADWFGRKSKPKTWDTQNYFAGNGTRDQLARPVTRFNGQITPEHRGTTVERL